MKKISFCMAAVLCAGLSAAPAVYDDAADWSQLAPVSEKEFVWRQFAPGDGGTSWYLRIHPADDRIMVQSCDMSASYITFDASRSYESCNDPDWGFPRMHYLSAVDFCAANPDVGYAGSESNGVFKTVDRGKSWSRVSTAPLERIFTWKFPRVPVSALAVHPADPNEVWIGMGFSRRLESTGRRRLPQGLAVSRDGGKNWTHLANAFPKNEMALAILFFPELPDTVIVGTDGGIHRSDDRGATFRSIAGNLPKGNTFGGFDGVLDPVTKKIVVAAALEAQYFIHEDGSVSNAGGIWMSDDGGEGRWREITGDLRIPAALINALPETRHNSPYWQFAIRMLWRDFMLDAENIQLYNELVLNYHKDPAPFHRRWNARRQSDGKLTELSRTLRDRGTAFLGDFHTVKIDPRNPKIVYASVFNPTLPYGLWKTSDGGRKWYCVSRGAQAWERPEWASYVPAGEKKLNIVQAWTARHPMNYGTPELLMGFWDVRKFDLSKSNPDVLYFHSHRVTYRSEDGGANWLDASNRIVDAKQHRFAGAGNSNMCVFDLAFHPRNPDRVLMWMADCGLKISDDGGRTFYGLPQVMVGSNQWVLGAAFDPADPDRFYAAFDCKDWLLKGIRGRYFLETRDFGKTFLNTEHHTDGSFRLPAKQPEFNAMIANLKVDPNSDSRMRRLLATHSNLGRYAVATGNPAFKAEAPALGVIESTDGGKSFHALNQGFGENRNVVDLYVSDDFKTLYAAVAMPVSGTGGPGGLYVSEDSGRHWKPVAVPVASVSKVVAAHGKLYLSGGVKAGGKKFVNAGGVWESSDAGATWRKLFAAPLVSNVAVSPVNPQIMYCTVERDLGSVMQGFGVYRSADGGRTWSRLNRGIAGPYNFTTLKFNPARPSEVWLGTYGNGFYMLADPAIQGN